MDEAGEHCLVAQALQGEDIVVARDGIPLIRLVPVEATAKPRLLGMLRGQIKIADDFDEPLEDFADYQ